MCCRGIPGEPRLVHGADGDAGPSPGCERSRTERGRLPLGSDLDRNAEQVGLELHQERVPGRAAVGTEDGRGIGQRIDDVGDLVRDRLERRPHQMGALSCRG